MTAPLIQSIQYSGTTLYIIFDRAVSVTGGSELDGFTFTQTPAPGAITPVFVSVDDNAIVATLPGAVAPTDTLTVVYDVGVGTVVEAVAPNSPVDSFSDIGIAYYSASLVRRAEVAASGANNTFTIFFSEPVGAAGGDLTAGLSVLVNAATLDLTGATAVLSDDQTELTVTVGSNFSYADLVDISYDAGTGTLLTWPSGVLADFAFTSVPSRSTDGLPNSNYPLSLVTKKKLVISAKNVTAQLVVSLNPVDRQLVTEYGPLQVYTGGIFGITLTNPTGSAVVGSTANVVDGTVLSMSFNNTLIADAVAAADEWEDVVAARLGIALGAFRATDQSLTVADDSVAQV